ncbi:MAG TPA: hypothetical protein VEJ18_19175, partial [Planctomycetota bacterium]|nr:hypothetical protein [Planctomycetota bacterium]
MPLSDEQIAALRAAAAREGVDADALIAAAESPSEPGQAPEGEKPKLYMYLLPFVTVKEVRSFWLGQTAPFPGDSMPAA